MDQVLAESPHWEDELMQAVESAGTPVLQASQIRVKVNFRMNPLALLLEPI
jgi:hypothetical protein